ncbi:MAG: hypothetical protein V1816_19210 [Pseudomonadota bacterium]
MKLERSLVWGFLLLTVMIMGCPAPPPTNPSLEPKQGAPEKIPEWLDKMPVDEVYFYAIGVSGPTRNPKDAWTQAAKRARVELGRTVISYVASISSSRLTDKGQYILMEETVISEAVLKHSEIVGRWFDRTGVHGFPSHYYLLLRMDKKEGKGLLAP